MADYSKVMVWKGIWTVKIHGGTKRLTGVSYSSWFGSQTSIIPHNTIQLNVLVPNLQKTWPTVHYNVSEYMG